MSASWWYANRAAGLVAWALLSASMVVGLLLSSKVLGKKVRPNWLQDLHRGLSGLSIAFVGVHVLAAVADDYVHFGAADVLVPGASGWRPLAIAYGIVGMYLMVAVEVSSLLRPKISKAIWRKIHFLSFPLFLSATAHAVTAGTEMGTTAGIGAAVLVTAAIVGLTAMRITDEIEKRSNATPAIERVPRRPIPSPAAAPAPLAPPTEPVSATSYVKDQPYVRPAGPPVEHTPAGPRPVRAGSPF